MDRLFDKLEDLLRALFGESSRPDRGRTADPDLKEAWDELEEYLRTGENRPRSRGPGPGSGGSSRKDHESTPRPPRADESLRRDYANLQVPFGAPFKQVQLAYKRLLHQHHPDRFGADPEQQRNATRITQEINASFLRIRLSMENLKKH